MTFGVFFRSVRSAVIKALNKVDLNKRGKRELTSSPTTVGTVCAFGRQNLAFRGHRDTIDSIQSIGQLNLVILQPCLDTELPEHSLKNIQFKNNS